MIYSPFVPTDDDSLIIAVTTHVTFNELSNLRSELADYRKVVLIFSVNYQDEEAMFYSFHYLNSNFYL